MVEVIGPNNIMSLRPDSIAVILVAFLFVIHPVKSQINSQLTILDSPLINITQVCKNYQIPVFNLPIQSGVQIQMNQTFDQTTELLNTTNFKFVSATIIKDCFHVALNSSARNTSTGGYITAPGANTTLALQVIFQMLQSLDTYTYIFPINPDSTLDPTTALNNILNFTATQSNPYGSIGYFESPGQFKALIQQSFAYPINTTGIYTCPNSLTTVNYNDFTYYRFNCLLAQDSHFNGYIYLTVTHSFPFWYLVIALLTFILLTNYLETDVEANEHMRNNYFLQYPLYSVFVAADDQIYPRRPRVALMYFGAFAIFWFNAVLDYKYVNIAGQADISLGMRLGTFAVCSAVFAYFFEFMLGFILSLYYKTNRVFLAKYKACESYDEKKLEIESYEEANFQLIHVFYFFFIILGLFFTITPIWFLYWFRTEDQAWWLLQGVIGILIKVLVFDFLLMFGSKIPLIESFVSLRGYRFDYDSYLGYSEIKKVL